MAAPLSRRRFVGATARLLGALAWAAPGARAAEAPAVRAIHDRTRNTWTGAIGVRLRGLLREPPDRAKDWPGAEREALPPSESEPALGLGAALARAAPARVFREQPLPLPRLARLLRAAYGVTGTSPQGIRLRAAPSAGALYAGEVYVVVERSEGLAPGVYAFAPLEDRLVRLRTGHVLDEVRGALEEPARADGAAAAVVLSNVFERYRWRYAHRGYRYALLDTGHIAENLRLAAASAGLATWTPRRFHDARLDRLLGLGGLREATCAVSLVGAPAEDPDDDADRRSATRRLVEVGRTQRSLPAGADDAPERYHAATRLVPGPEAEPRARTSSGGDATPPPEGEPLPLSARELPAEAVEAVIARRRSTRRFEEAPLRADELGAVLAATRDPTLEERAPEVFLRVFVHRVEDVPPGLHHAEPGARRLVPLRRGSLAAALAQACLGQEKAAQAAVAFAIGADLARAEARAGARVYRDLCIVCGSMAQRLYLAAEALGLTARNLAAYVDERLDALAELDGARHTLHLTLLGRGD